MTISWNECKTRPMTYDWWIEISDHVMKNRLKTLLLIHIAALKDFSIIEQFLSHDLSFKFPHSCALCNSFWPNNIQLYFRWSGLVNRIIDQNQLLAARSALIHTCLLHKVLSSTRWCYGTIILYARCVPFITIWIERDFGCCLLLDIVMKKNTA